jgi:iron complex outermembrane receptor protein
MSELIQKNDNRATIRWKLLASVSAAALIASSIAADETLAADSDVSRPLVWIELGAQLERASGGDDMFKPLFYGDFAPSLDSPAKIAGELPWAFGPEAKISFQPNDSHWLFSAGIRYGRAKSTRSSQQNTNPPSSHIVRKYPSSKPIYSQKCCHTFTFPAYRANFADVQSVHQESHLILDFQAGKDVGLGLFGKDSSSVVSAGVRFAQFSTRSDISVKGRTDLEHYNYLSLLYGGYFLARYPQKYAAASRFRINSLDAGSSRSFQGVGPSISWDASATLAGNPDSSELTFDWGVNAALLFGKQKVKTHHQSMESVFYFASGYTRAHPAYGYTSLYNHPRTDHTRSRRVTVPNVGGMAGFSIKFPNAKISVGYRADYFFGAMDGGWDTYKKQTRSFMGPYASISIGLGD